MPPQTIKLAAVGDIALTHEYDQLLSTKGPNYPFDKVRDFLKSHEIVFGNLEAPISLNGEAYPLKCSLRIDPKYLPGIKSAGFNILSLANNHILDYKEEAFFETLKNLDRQGINWFGAGRNIREARKPSIVEIKGVKIGFLGYCDVVIESPFYASIDARGIVPLKMETIERDVTNLNKQVDMVIVSLHWGTENMSYPSPHQVDIAHKIIDFGADLILGHHPHVLQGIENYKHGYIAYSLGNFIFSDIGWTWINEKGERRKSAVKLNKINKETAILSVIFDKTGIKKIGLSPCVISDGHLPVICEENKEFRKKLERLSNKISIENYPAFWRRYYKIQKYKLQFFRNIKRVKKIHKLRLRHFKEIVNIVRFEKKELQDRAIISKLKIVYIIDQLEIGGTEKQLLETIKLIDKEKIKVILICLRPSEYYFESEVPCENYIIHVYSLLSGNALLSFIKFILFLKKQEIDIVQTYFFDSTVFGVLAARIAGVKRIISCRRDLGFWYTPTILRVLKCINPLVHRFLVNSHAVKENIAVCESIPHNKIDVIYNGIDLEPFKNSYNTKAIRRDLGISEDDYVVGMITNLNRPVKRADLFITAASKVLKNKKNVSFLIIGDGDLRSDLEKLSEMLNVQDKVYFAGLRQNIYPYLTAFDIGVISSDSEGFSNSILEYMAAGVPVIATEVGGNKEIIEEGVNGALVSPGDYESLAKKIGDFLKYPEKRLRLAKNATRLIWRQYAWDSRVKEIEAYYRGLFHME